MPSCSVCSLNALVVLEYRFNCRRDGADSAAPLDQGDPAYSAPSTWSTAALTTAATVESTSGSPCDVRATEPSATLRLLLRGEPGFRHGPLRATRTPENHVRHQEPTPLVG